ncbi:MAG TPA: transglycosylase SLT domain-containing protein [Gemmatimonadaceae bacterium]|jgi:hypothetical protein|nr:transglycosylase SLT domain-containing protein [Gemmatimonadaceae bacterium]
MPRSRLCLAHAIPVPEDRIERVPSVRSQLLIVLACLSAIIVTVRLSRPFYVESHIAVGAQLAEHRYVDSMEVRAPWLHASAEIALRTPQFLLDRERFAMDLLRTGHVNQTRARALADVAVREAYTRRIPPALVLGVMLTENDRLNSAARSNVGAIGLMQVSPKPWRAALARKFGGDIRADSTNLKYGIYILGWLAEKTSLLVGDRDTAWRQALLGYNGCVNVPSTHKCLGYPEVVRRQVQTAAKFTCPDADFDRCVAQPMWIAHGDLGRGDSAQADSIAASRLIDPGSLIH